MSRSMYGLHKAAGGFAARWRQAWEQLATGQLTCPLKRRNVETHEESACGQPAAGLVETIYGEPRPICAAHIPRARERGYPVYESAEDRRRALEG